MSIYKFRADVCCVIQCMHIVALALLLSHRPASTIYQCDGPHLRVMSFGHERSSMKPARKRRQVLSVWLCAATAAIFLTGTAAASAQAPVVDGYGGAGSVVGQVAG